MEIVVAIIGSSALTTLITALVNKKKKKSALEKGVMFSLLYVLQIYGEKLISKGSVTQLEYNQFSDMYATYKALEGDGYADLIKADVDKLDRR